MKRSSEKEKGPFKYHNVYVGRQVGIFTSWFDCKKSVTKFHNAIHKGYNNLDKAILNMERAGILNPFFYGECPGNIRSRKIDENVYMILSQDTEDEITSQNLCSYTSRSDSNLHFDHSIQQGDDQTQPKEIHSQTMTKIIENNQDLEDIFFDTEVSFDTQEGDIDFDDMNHINLNSSKEGFEYLLNVKDENSNLDQHTNTINTSDKRVSPTKSSLDNQRESHNLPKIEKDARIQEPLKMETYQFDKLMSEIYSLKVVLSEVQNVHNTTLRKTEEKLAQLQNDNEEMKSHINTLCYQTSEVIKSIKENSAMIDELKNDKKIPQEINHLSAQCAEMKDAMLKQNNHALKNAMKHYEDEQEKLPPPYRKNQNILQVSPRITKTNESKCSWMNTNEHMNIKESTENVERTYSEVLKATKSSSSTSSTKQSTLFENDDEFTWLKERNYREKINEKENYIKKNSLFVSEKCKNILVGDSNMKNVIRKKLDRTGRTEVRTYRGATVKILSDIIEKSTTYFPHVEKITVCVGTNDCSRGEINETTLLNNFDHLIKVIKEVFPNAIINFLAIPHMKNAKANKFLMQVNRKLKKLVIDRGALFRTCDTLWFHVNNDGSVDNGLLYDAVHLTDWGLGLLLQNVIPFFYDLQFNRRHTKPFLPNPEPIFNEETFPHLRQKESRNLPQDTFSRGDNQQTRIMTLETWV